MTSDERPPRPSSAPSRRTFLKGVFICSLGAYGRPETHISVFLNQMVHKKGYLTEEELIEFLALNGILPGPTSTQTIVSIGYKAGGRLLALLSLLVWALPVIGLMTAASFAYGILERRGLSTSVLRFVGPMAVGFIIYAAVRAVESALGVPFPRRGNRSHLASGSDVLRSGIRSAFRGVPPLRVPSSSSVSPWG
ncbi:MAG: chromate transporter [Alkalispirochaeta sp.]